MTEQEAAATLRAVAKLNREDGRLRSLLTWKRRDSVSMSRVLVPIGLGWFTETNLPLFFWTNGAETIFAYHAGPYVDWNRVVIGDLPKELRQ